MQILNKMKTIRKSRNRMSTRRYWVKPFSKDRFIFGAYKTIFLYFKENDYPEF